MSITDAKVKSRPHGTNTRGFTPPAFGGELITVMTGVVQFATVWANGKSMWNFSSWTICKKWMNSYIHIASVRNNTFLWCVHTQSEINLCAALLPWVWPQDHLSWLARVNTIRKYVPSNFGRFSMLVGFPDIAQIFRLSSNISTPASEANNCANLLASFHLLCKM